MMTLLAVENTFLVMNLDIWKQLLCQSLEKLKQKTLKYIKPTKYFHSFLIFNLMHPWQNWVPINGFIIMTQNLHREEEIYTEERFLFSMF